eukprot:CAMPEP_0196590026 /NCGR_PEP_ID=MMETSP1081-20130531/65309_1 /TAXON_ID=36882 /ORGANISM="Pyramimonas amylifera, Strain CCMP720" /LENGTH=141 /DNA_ID=CAMNT_0041912997 /DNA_START=145 /DNA_END=570 /DNA_ORIENTATION=-
MLAKDGAEPFDAPDPRNITEFHRILQQDFNIPVTIRMTMGQDINGACGQLALKKGVRAPADIEDIGGKLSVKTTIEDRVQDHSTEPENCSIPTYYIDDVEEEGSRQQHGWSSIERSIIAVAALTGTVLFVCVGLSLNRRTR